MELVRDRETVVRLPYRTGGKQWSNPAGYKHVRPPRIEDEPYVWEA